MFALLPVHIAGLVPRQVPFSLTDEITIAGIKSKPSVFFGFPWRGSFVSTVFTQGNPGCLIWGCCGGAPLVWRFLGLPASGSLPVRLCEWPVSSEAAQAGAISWGNLESPKKKVKRPQHWEEEYMKEVLVDFTYLVFAWLFKSKEKQIVGTWMSLEWRFPDAWCHVVCCPSLAVRSQQLTWAVGLS